MARARGLSDLRREGSPPFRLRARLSYLDPDWKKGEGTYLLVWASNDTWREEIAWPGYEETSGCRAGSCWTRSNLDYRPLRAFDVVGALDLGSKLTLPPLATDHLPRRRKVRTETCVPTQRRDRLPAARLCFDGETGLLTREEFGQAGVFKPFVVTQTFSDYRPWGDKQVPWSITRTDSGREVLRVAVLDLSAGLDEDSPTFGPPQDARTMVRCTPEDEQPGAQCEEAEGLERLGLAMPRGPGKVGIRAVVGRDGRIHDPSVVGSSNPELAHQYRQLVILWKCKPITCRGVPSDAETYLEWEVNF